MFNRFTISPTLFLRFSESLQLVAPPAWYVSTLPKMVVLRNVPVQTDVKIGLANVNTRNYPAKRLRRKTGGSRMPQRVPRKNRKFRHGFS